MSLRANETDKLAGFRQLSVSVCKCWRRKSSFRHWFVVACFGVVVCVSCCVERYTIRLIQIDTPNNSYIDTCAVKEIIRPFRRTYYCKYLPDKKRFDK